MTDSISLSQIRSKARFRADMVSSLFVTDAELNSYIQDSYKELYDLLCDAVEDYNITAVTKTVSNNAGTITVEADFYKLRGIDDLTDTANPRTVLRYVFGERNDYLFTERVLIGSEYSDIRYRLAGQTLYLTPPEKANGTYKIWYTPTPTVPAIDSDTIDAVNGWDEYLVIDAAIKCKIKEEADTRALEKAKAFQYERVLRMSKNRDANLPEKVTRVRNRKRNGLYSYLGDPSF